MREKKLRSAINQESVATTLANILINFNSIIQRLGARPDHWTFRNVKISKKLGRETSHVNANSLFRPAEM